MTETSTTTTKKLFPDVFGISDYELPPPRTLNELLMIKLSFKIRSKPSWWKKYQDAEIRKRWREEALLMRMVWIERATMLVPYEVAMKEYLGLERDGGRFEDSVVELSEEEVEYVLDELDGYARLRDEETGIEVSCFDGIWHADTLIDHKLRKRLQNCVRVLEDVPDSEKDWHPGSNEQVLDLVHPSLYCVVYNRTHAHTFSGSCSRSESQLKEDDSNVLEQPEFRPLPAPTFNSDANLDSTLFSVDFQWLPTDFTVSATDSITKGKEVKVKALGYINNIQPPNTELYEVIEDVLGGFVPLFEHVLTDMINPLPHRLPGNYGPPPKSKEGKSTDDDGDEDEEEWSNDYTGEVTLPKLPDGGYTGGLEKREDVVSLRGRTIQVIVKLANIHLTPEKPEYMGGSWHVEGMVNERIVASGIYYYDQENITDSELAFRIAVDEPEPGKTIQAEAYDYKACYKTWGMLMDYTEPTRLNNVVGATTTLPNRCLAFPNTYQHRVSPFRLEDPSKPGHRKILALFLVDPNLSSDLDPDLDVHLTRKFGSGEAKEKEKEKYKRIPSTSTIPPQQRHWFSQTLHSLQTPPNPNPPSASASASASASSFLKLPTELIDMILDELVQSKVLMNKEEAKKFREELMNERRVVQSDLESGFLDDWQEMGNLFSRGFNLCEH